MKPAIPWMMAVLATAALALGIPASANAADGSATGTLTYKVNGSPIAVTLKYVWLIKGPDAMNPKLIIRHLIFSATDIGAKIAACKTMSCTDSDLGSGMTVDLGSGPRLNYWVSLNDQRVQYSGTAMPDALKLATDTPTRMAGKLTIDDSTAGGATAEVDFDAPLLRELSFAR